MVRKNQRARQRQERSTFRVKLFMHIGVLLLEPFFTLFHSPAELAILAQIVVSLRIVQHKFLRS